jgi:hypothetical protein
MNAKNVDALEALLLLSNEPNGPQGGARDGFAWEEIDAHQARAMAEWLASRGVLAPSVLNDSIERTKVQLVLNATRARMFLEHGNAVITAMEGLKWLLGEDPGYDIEAAMRDWIEAGAKGAR